MAGMRPRPNRSPLERGRRTFRYIYLRLVRVGGDPVHVALGFSLGVFLGVFPTFGLGIPLALLLASALRWNRVAATVGSLVMNPLTTPFFWTLSGTVGAAIFRTDVRNVLTSVQDGERFRALTHGVGIYLVGNTIVALAFSAAAYFLALRAVVLYRRKKRERKRRRRQRQD
jgi:uncharacterized protein